MCSTKASFRRKLRRLLKKIPLKDQCLLIIMSILILQLIINLFTWGTITPEASDIDLIFRTTIASVFGYILSSKFLNFDFISECIPVKTENSIKTCNHHDELNEIKIIITTVIALISIFVLISYRKFSLDNTILITDNHKAIVVQFRNFISGCVGFLLGSDGKSKIDDD